MEPTRYGVETTVREDALASSAVPIATEQKAGGRLSRLGHRDSVYTPRRRFSLRLFDFWAYRHLLPYLGWEFVRRKYRGQWLGWLWVPLRPTIDMSMRALVFGGFLGVASQGQPYIIFLIVGSAGWRFFEITSLWGWRSLRIHQRVAGKVPVPWAVPVASAATPGLVDAALYGVLGLVVATYYEITRGSFYIEIGGSTWYAAVGMLMLALYAWTLAAWAAPLVVRVPDFHPVLRYVLRFWYFLTPVLYTVETIPPKYRGLAEYNPITAPIELVKQGLLDTAPPTEASIRISLVVLLVTLPTGLLVLARAERRAHARL